MGYGLNGSPLSQCQGYDTTDVNDYLILVQSSINDVVQASSQVWTVDKWHHDVYGYMVEMANCGLLVFQLSNHPWTILREMPALIQSSSIDNNSPDKI